MFSGTSIRQGANQMVSSKIVAWLDKSGDMIKVVFVKYIVIHLLYYTACLRKQYDDKDLI